GRHAAAHVEGLPAAVGLGPHHLLRQHHHLRRTA
ncbi:MAG: hypothetical protein AVDCRST_MAG61-805, partial [uncultured Friedmanniella sp.]